MSETIYKVKPGDSISAIAARYGVSADELCRKNNIKDKNVIMKGQSLFIPKRDKITSNSEKNSSIFSSALQKAIDEYDTTPVWERNISFDEVVKKLNQYGKTASNVHIIKKGDTLSEIAQKNGISLQALKNANPNIDERRLQPGAKLVIPPKPAVEISKTFGLNVANKNTSNANSAAQKVNDILQIAEKHAKAMEGFVPKAKKCPSGYYTYGYGHRIGVKAGQSISRGEAASLLRKDLKEALDGIKDALGKKAYDNLNEKQLAALVNMAFNAGLSGTVNSEYFSLIKQGKLDEAQAKMDAVFGNKTDKNGRVVRDKGGNAVKNVKMGLLTRRAKEMVMFGDGELSPDAEKRLLTLLNQGLNTTFKSLDSADVLIKKRLNELEIKNEKHKSQMTTAEKRRLIQLRNVQELFEVLREPREYLARLDKEDNKFVKG